MDGGRERERGNLRRLREEYKDGRNERIMGKLERGGLRGSCRRCRITFRSRGKSWAACCGSYTAPHSLLPVVSPHFSHRTKLKRRRILISTDIFSLHCSRKVSSVASHRDLHSSLNVNTITKILINKYMNKKAATFQLDGRDLFRTFKWHWPPARLPGLQIFHFFRAHLGRLGQSFLYMGDKLQ